jgi:head-tail adaptor
MPVPPLGALRHRIAWETPTRTPDGHGGASLTWTHQADLWAAITTPAGTEIDQSDAIVGRMRWRIIVRAGRDIAPSHRMRWGRHTLDVRAVRRLDEGDTHLVIDALEQPL